MVLGLSKAFLQQEIGHEDVKVTDGYVKDYAGLLQKRHRLPLTPWEDWLKAEEAKGGKESGGESA